MKNVLVLIHDDPGQEARLQASLDLARALDGHLTFLDVVMLPPTVDVYEGVAAGAVLMEEEILAEHHNREKLLPRLQREDVPFEWVETKGDAAACLADAMRMADIIVTNSTLSGHAYPDMFGIASDLILSTGTPVLAIPDSLRRFDPRGDALVAWDGSRDADAALRAALPLLAMARSVALFYVQDGSIRIPISEAAAWLSRHGVHCYYREEPALFDLASAVLLAEARLIRADYMVMGGYSRSRWIEAAFGGATRTLLKEAPLPLFIAHH